MLLRDMEGIFISPLDRRVLGIEAHLFGSCGRRDYGGDVDGNSCTGFRTGEAAELLGWTDTGFHKFF
jgi:hypothetical protein